MLTDNGHAYRSHAWRDLCGRLGIERRRTRPYTPRTNGKAEAFIGTALREWAYRYAYPTSAHRTRALPGWVRWYNRRRPHSSLGDRPPISRVAQVRGQPGDAVPARDARVVLGPHAVLLVADPEDVLALDT